MGCCSSASDPLLYSKRESPEGSINLHLQSRNINSIRESYTIIRTLGSGSLGCVYLVKDKRSGLERAAKELLKSLMNQNSLENFFNELTILNYLVSSKQDHPSIMRVYEIIETTTRIYLITEYLSGGQLFEKLVASEMITEKLAAKYLNDIVLGLNYCHRNNVIHRDIKPENLLLESDAPDAHLKLIDFGISSIYKSELSIIQASVGAVGYMAPERFKGFISTKSDIWSAGVILYTMLCGKPPFQAGTDHDTAKLITNCKLDLTDEIWENISLEAKTLLVKMLDKDPKLRPTAETILSDPWLFAYSRNTIRNELIDPMALENLSKFNARNKLEKSIFSFISTQVMSSNDEKKLAYLFKSLDKNGDGTLNRDEIEEGYDALGIPVPGSINDLLKRMESSGNGTIYYHEFLTASQDWSKISQQKELESAFKIYDQGGDGTLSILELKKAIPGLENTEWDLFLTESDTNADGLISLEELKVYLTTRSLSP